MIKRPWQIWSLFLLSLLIVFPAMTWLTIKGLELDRAEGAAQRQAEAARRAAETARRESEFNELVGRALWRLDWTLTPLIAQEAARPYFVFQAFHCPSGPDGEPGEPVASPLLMQPSEFVLLHFEVGPDGTWRSPQRPEPNFSEFAIACGVTPQNIETSDRRLTTLSTCVEMDRLDQLLPDELLPSLSLDSLAQNAISPFFQTARVYESVLGDETLPGQTIEILGSEAEGDVESPLAQAPAPPPLAAGNEWIRRNRGFQTYAQNQMVQQRAAQVPEPLASLVREGVSRPIWIDSKLLLARRVLRQDEVYWQGCWLDWPRIREVLLEEIADLLPEADLQPVVNPDTEVPPGRLLATLPVQLVAMAEPVEARGTAGDPNAWSALRVSLVAAWGCLLTATLSVALLLHGVIALSERRGAFVSAVTHELRTPLTTFRMYAEMLAEDMVSSDAARKEYTETLRVEADRLSHLVENVLQYARLERGRRLAPRQRVTVGQLSDAMHSRLKERARQSAMTLVVELDEAATGTTLVTDPAAVEQIVFNLVDNACKYAAAAGDRRIHLEWSAAARQILLRVWDHGPGIAGAQACELFRPFSKTVDEAAMSAPGVGLGLALSRRLARDLGGRLDFEPDCDEGACFCLTLPRG